jgi:hypothetical protein
VQFVWHFFIVDGYFVWIERVGGVDGCQGAF